MTLNIILYKKRDTYIDLSDISGCSFWLKDCITTMWSAPECEVV